MRGRVLVRFASALAFVAACTQGLDPAGNDGTTTDAADFKSFLGLPEWNGILELQVQVRRSGGEPIRAGSRFREYGAQVTARNVGAVALVGETHPDYWWFRAYASPERSGDPVWSGPLFNPRQFLESVDIRPGESRLFMGGDLPVPDTVPAGTYYFTASLKFTPDLHTYFRTAFFPAGQATVHP
ncbi:MAG TPA: hypothetical protein VGA37_13675 [Gemmatimonadales bacterium]